MIFLLYIYLHTALSVVVSTTHSLPQRRTFPSSSPLIHPYPSISLSPPPLSPSPGRLSLHLIAFPLLPFFGRCSILDASQDRNSARSRGKENLGRGDWWWIFFYLLPVRVLVCFLLEFIIILSRVSLLWVCFYVLVLY